MKFVNLLCICGSYELGSVISPAIGIPDHHGPMKVAVIYGTALLCLLMVQARRWLDPNIQAIIRDRRRRALERCR